MGVTTFYQVDTWRDDNYLSSDDDLRPLLAADICAFAAVNCSLRAAFWYASSLPGDDVTITLNAGKDLLLTQGDYIPLTGYEHHIQKYKIYVLGSQRYYVVRVRSTRYLVLYKFVMLDRHLRTVVPVHYTTSEYARTGMIAA